MERSLKEPFQDRRLCTHILMELYLRQLVPVEEYVVQ